MAQKFCRTQMADLDFLIGVWLFHCHIEWHMQSGLAATFIEAPLDLQRTLTIPEDHLAACASQGIPTAGNAAGNAINFLDLSGQHAPPGRLPQGYVLDWKPLCSCPFSFASKLSKVYTNIA